MSRTLLTAGLHGVCYRGEGEAVMQAVYVDHFKYVRLIRTLRAFRALKLMRHFAETHILSVALKNAARQILVPGFAMLVRRERANRRTQPHTQPRERMHHTPRESERTRSLRARANAHAASRASAPPERTLTLLQATARTASVPHAL
jgi:hypothetical protein